LSWTKQVINEDAICISSIEHSEMMIHEEKNRAVLKRVVNQLEKTSFPNFTERCK
jgi:hypothetical protein